MRKTRKQKHKKNTKISKKQNMADKKTTLENSKKHVIKKLKKCQEKNKVAVNAWLPQAKQPCGNLSDTSS